jgi:hypothetical protein
MHPDAEQTAVSYWLSLQYHKNPNGSRAMPVYTHSKK